MKNWIQKLIQLEPVKQNKLPNSNSNLQTVTTIIVPILILSSQSVSLPLDIDMINMIINNNNLVQNVKR